MSRTKNQELLEDALRWAQRFQRQGDAVQLCETLHEALMHSLAVALHPDLSVDEGIAKLNDLAVRRILYEIHEAQALLERAILDRHVQQGVGCNTYSTCVAIHVAMALEESECAENILETSRRIDCVSSSTAFWCEYCRALGCFLSLDEYRCRFKQEAQGLEKYWLLYLRLVEEISKGGGVQDAIQVAEEGFERRNRDRRLSDDWYEIEGTGRAPVGWDFRLESIVRFGREHYRGSFEGSRSTPA